MKSVRSSVLRRVQHRGAPASKRRMRSLVMKSVRLRLLLTKIWIKRAKRIRALKSKFTAMASFWAMILTRRSRKRSKLPKSKTSNSSRVDALSSAMCESGMNAAAALSIATS